MWLLILLPSLPTMDTNYVVTYRAKFQELPFTVINTTPQPCPTLLLPPDNHYVAYGCGSWCCWCNGPPVWPPLTTCCWWGSPIIHVATHLLLVTLSYRTCVHSHVVLLLKYSSHRGLIPTDTFRQEPSSFCSYPMFYVEIYLVPPFIVTRLFSHFMTCIKNFWLLAPFGRAITYQNENNFEYKGWHITYAEYTEWKLWGRPTCECTVFMSV